MMIRALFVVAVLVTALGDPRPAGAWGTEGHAVIADIAEAHLTPRARTAVRDLLALDSDLAARS